MAITGTDSLGSYVDTGAGSAWTVRPSLDVEFHTSKEVDTGSSLAPVSQSTIKSPHRPSGSPR